MRKMGPTPIDRRRGGFGLGQDARDRRAGIKQRKQQIDAPGAAVAIRMPSMAGR
jgi:hypothetical protein